VRIIIAAIGRLKKGPEQELVSRYQDRVAKSGKAMGFTAVETIEITESRAGSSDLRKKEEARALLSRLPDKTFIFCFDERGKRPTSREFASLFETQMDKGTKNIALLIGGPDGFCDSVHQNSNEIISFGSLTLPHQLVRVLVLEQLYRAVTILTGHPYHRE